MGKLVITDSQGVISECMLDKERITLGRSDQNDITIPDRAVSGKHAVIVTILEDSFLEDVGSTNGTHVNGEPVTRHTLAHGDIITIGRNTIRYVGPEEAGVDAEQTMIAGSMPMAAPPPPAPAPPTPDARKLAIGLLRFTSGRNAGKEIKLTKPVTTLGKRGVQVIAITRKGEGYFIVQVEGADGRQLRINNLDVPGTPPHQLADGDVIELVGTQIEFALDD